MNEKAKTAYIVCSHISSTILIALAVICPIYLTVDKYWWTAFFILLYFAACYGYSKRLNSWGDFGNTEDNDD